MSREFWLDPCFTGLTAPFCISLLGWVAGVQVQGTGRQLGSFWRPGRFFFFPVWRALPTFIFALLQAECACQTQTRSFSSQVKAGTILATRQS